MLQNETTTGAEMNTYVYKADIYCPDCAAQIIRGLSHSPFWPNSMREDSEHYPQGPFADGGGEADCPQHCGACGLFLENPLTSDGVKYVRERVELAHGKPELLAEWRAFYGDQLQLESA